MDAVRFLTTGEQKKLIINNMIVNLVTRMEAFYSFKQLTLSRKKTTTKLAWFQHWQVKFGRLKLI